MTPDDDETFCIYCQRQFATPVTLRRHIELKHPGTYAFYSVNLSHKKAAKQ